MVANELVRLAREEDPDGFDEKNIRRRVYDALNVLTALDIITKNKKSIRWNGLPAVYHSEYEQLKQEEEKLRHQIEQKTRSLHFLRDQRAALHRLYDRNKQKEYAEMGQESRLYLPFLILSTPKDTHIHVDMCEDHSEVSFEFSQPFEIHDDMSILRLLGLCPEDSPAGGASRGSERDVPLSLSSRAGGPAAASSSGGGVAALESSWDGPSASEKSSPL